MGEHLVVPRWLGAILALLSGLALPFAFAPTEWWILSIASIFVFYGLLQSLTPRQALWIGWLFGLGYFGIGVHWVYYSLHLFGAAIAPLAALLTLVFVIVMTIFPALTAYVWTRFRPSNRPLSNAFLFAALWVIAELLRGKIMNGFPWILVGYSQTSAPLGELAPLTGVYGLSFIVVLIACLLVACMRSDTKNRVVALIFLLLPFLAAWGTKNVTFSTETDEPLTVRMVQANIAQEMKFSEERLRNSLVTYTTMTQLPGLSDVDLVVWPETAIPTYFDNVSGLLAPFLASMDEHGVEVLSGGFEREEGRSYNAVRQLGGERQVYKKRHLVPFGEYMPLRFILEFAAKFIVIPMSDLAAGDGPNNPLILNGVKVGLSICYEDVFGEEMRTVLPDAQLLVNVSNDAWFGNSAAPHQHEQKARMRAREFARPLIRVTNTGISSAIDHKGKVSTRIAHNISGIEDVTVYPRDGLTPYARTGNWPIFIISILLIFTIGLTRRRISD